MEISKVVSQVVTLATLKHKQESQTRLKPLLLFQGIWILWLLMLYLFFCVVYAPSYPASATELVLIVIHQHSWQCNSPDTKL